MFVFCPPGGHRYFDVACETQVSLPWLCWKRLEDGLRARAVDPHTFFMDHDPAVFLNADLDLSDFADPDPALKLCKKSPNKEFL